MSTEVTKLKEFVHCGNSKRNINVFKTQEAANYVENAKKNNKSVIGIVHRQICNQDGNVIWEFLGHNDTLIGGTQNTVLNTYANLDKSKMTTIASMDSESGMNLDTVSRYLTTNRLIFGIAVAHDGASLLQEAVVKRHSKGYTNGKLMAFQSLTAGLDNPEENFKKYALRNTATNGEIQYFIKKVTPKFDNITVDTEVVIPNNPDAQYQGNSDIMTRVTIDISISPEELVAWWGATYGTTEGGYFNSFMLVAGREAEVSVGGRSYQTYRDIICTNKINFLNKPIKNAKVEKFSYELYYV